MNEAQHLKYRICGAKAVKAMKQLGHEGTHKELTAYCRRKALGEDKDSRALNNTEFDAVLAVFAGYAEMGNLDEQLRLLDQPLKRILYAARRFLDELDIKEPGREAYLAAIYKRVQAKRPARGEWTYALANIPDEDFPLILGALNHTLEHKQGKRKTWHRKTKPAPQPRRETVQENMPF
jgi:hypothetical protein